MRAIMAIVAAAALCCPALAQKTFYYVNGDCGDDAWSATSTACAAPDGPKRTIAAAVKAAAPGDSIHVAHGVYRGPGNINIDFAGKDIAVSGLGVVIDCEGLGRAFVFRSGETRDALIDGFTIRNGVAPGVGGDLRGGGIAILSPSFGSPAPSPRIRRCTFEDCDTGIYNGGAMLI